MADNHFFKSGFEYLKPSKSRLSKRAKEAFRQRFYRSWLFSFSKFYKPLKVLGFSLILISLCFLAITQLKRLFFGTSYFELKQLTVKGGVTLDRAYILKSAGIAPGRNIFLFNKEDIVKNLLQIPLIKSASAEFDGMYNLVITIKERLPFLYAKVGADFYEIAEDGIIINTKGCGEKDLPIIAGLNLSALGLGDSAMQVDAFYAAHNWAKTLGSEILSGISEINFKNPQSPYIILLSGEKVYPKSLEEFKNRYYFLCALLDNLRQNNVKPIYLDMRAPNGIVVRPKK